MIRIVLDDSLFLFVSLMEMILEDFGVDDVSDTFPELCLDPETVLCEHEDVAEESLLVVLASVALVEDSCFVEALLM